MLASVLLLAASALAVPPSMPSAEERQQRREMNGLRVMKVERVLAAAKSQDEATLKDEGAFGVPYFLGFNDPVSAPSGSPFDASSLVAFAECEPSQPEVIGIDWVSVNWTCPAAVSTPWSSTSTAFKFEAVAIIEIRTTPGPPSLIVR